MLQFSINTSPIATETRNISLHQTARFTLAFSKGKEKGVNFRVVSQIGFVIVFAVEIIFYSFSFRLLSCLKVVLPVFLEVGDCTWISKFSWLSFFPFQPVKWWGHGFSNEKEEWWCTELTLRIGISSLFDARFLWPVLWMFNTIFACFVMTFSVWETQRTVLTGLSGFVNTFWCTLIIAS